MNGCSTAAMGLPATRKTATEERIIRILIGRSNKASRDELHGGVILCNGEKVDKIIAAIVESSSTFCKRLWQQQKWRDKLLPQCVTLGNFWCNLRRNKTARQVCMIMKNYLVYKQRLYNTRRRMRATYSTHKETEQRLVIYHAAKDWD